MAASTASTTSAPAEPGQSAATSRTSTPRRGFDSLDVETHPRATLGLHHGRLAEIPASRYQVLGESRVVHLEQRVPGVEDESPDGRAARHDGEFTAPESSRRSRSPVPSPPGVRPLSEDEALAS